MPHTSLHANHALTVPVTGATAPSLCLCLSPLPGHHSLLCVLKYLSFCKTQIKGHLLQKPFQATLHLHLNSLFPHGLSACLGPNRHHAVWAGLCVHTCMYVQPCPCLPKALAPTFPPPSGKGPLILGRRLQPSPSQIGLSSLLFPSHPLSSAPLPSPSPKAWGPPAVNTMPLTCVQVH